MFIRAVLFVTVVAMIASGAAAKEIVDIKGVQVAAEIECPIRSLKQSVGEPYDGLVEINKIAQSFRFNPIETSTLFAMCTLYEKGMLEGVKSRSTKADNFDVEKVYSVAKNLCSDTLGFDDLDKDSVAERAKQFSILSSREVDLLNYMCRMKREGLVAGSTQVTVKTTEHR
jgi:hypothetical protein